MSRNGVLMLLTWLFFVVPAAVRADQFGDFTYSTDGTNAAITGYTGSGGVVTIPDSINSHPVISIGNSAFAECPRLYSIEIPDGVTNVGNSAFNFCPVLANAVIGNGVTSIGSSAFEFCTNLTNVTLGTNVIVIGESAFDFCTSLVEVSFPGSLSIIDRFAFDFCTNLASVEIPSRVVSIGDAAFWTCSDLKTVTIPNGVTNLGNSAFGFCSGLTNLIIGSCVQNIGNYAFQYCSALSVVTIPDAVTNIGYQAFSDCTNLVNVTIGVGVNKIQDNAFGDCTSLVSIKIPPNVTYIGFDVFSSCTSMTAINVDPQNSWYSSIDGVLFNKDRTLVVECPTGKTGTYTLPDSVTSLRLRAFANCPGLTNVVIGQKVNDIGNGAFEDCSNLSGVYFEGDSPASIGYNVFSGSLHTTIYYLSAKLGWWAMFGDCFTSPWLPRMPVDTSFGVRSNQFGFNINWAREQTVMVEACVNLSNPEWEPLQTNTLSTGSAYFSDPQWTNYPSRFYRIRSP